MAQDKVADLVTMSTQIHDHDPHPDLPRCFTKKHEVVELVQGVTGQGALADVVEPDDDEAKPLTISTSAEDEAPRDERPKPLVRTCVATLESSDVLGPMIAAKAHGGTSSRPKPAPFWATAGRGSGPFIGPTFPRSSPSSISYTC